MASSSKDNKTALAPVEHKISKKHESSLHDIFMKEWMPKFAGFIKPSMKDFRSRLGKGALLIELVTSWNTNFKEKCIVYTDKHEYCKQFPTELMNDNQRYPVVIAWAMKWDGTCEEYFCTEVTESNIQQHS